MHIALQGDIGAGKFREIGARPLAIRLFCGQIAQIRAAASTAIMTADAAPGDHR